MTKKEGKGEGNMIIGPRIKYGHARHISFHPRADYVLIISIDTQVQYLEEGDRDDTV